MESHQGELGEAGEGVEHEERIVKMKLKIIQNALSVISFEWTQTPTPLPTLLLPLPLLAAFGDRLVWVWFLWGVRWLCQSEKPLKSLTAFSGGMEWCHGKCLWWISQQNLQCAKLVNWMGTELDNSHLYSIMCCIIYKNAEGSNI